MPEATPEPIRVGLLLDSLEQPAWARYMLERIAAADHAEIACAVLNKGESRAEAGPQPRPPGRLRSYWRNRRVLMYTAYNRYERLRFNPEPDAFERKDISALIEDVPRIPVHPRRTTFSDFIEGEELERVREARVDVFIRLGFRILRGGILEAARYGVWSYHHGDNLVNRGGPAGFWEVMERHPQTGAILQILNEDLDNGFVLGRTWSRTDQMSVRVNRNRYYWKAASILPRKIAELHRLGGEAFKSAHEPLNRHPHFYTKRLYVRPSNREMLWAGVRHFGRYVKRALLHRFTLEQWQLRYSFRDGMSTSLWRFKEIRPPRDRFWADPFVIHRDGRYYIFIEEYPYKTGRGHISVITMESDGSYADPVPVLERPYHLSYPFLFEWQGELYMLPETLGNGTVEAYRCVEFPHTWEHAATLMADVKAVDATLFEHGGKWWMFAALRENGGGQPPGDDLFLFHADSPLSQNWTPHPANPVVSDVRCARPAGQIFQHRGRWYRPAQDGSHSYGSGMHIHEIQELTEETYREAEVDGVFPEWAPNLLGVHSLAQAGRLTVVDVRERRWRGPFGR